MKTRNNLQLRASAVVYFIATLGWSWLFWTASVWLTPDSNPSVSPIFLLGGAGPFLVAVFLTHWRENTTVQRSFWIRVFDFRRIRGVWWLAALLLHPAIVAFAFVLDLALGGSLPKVQLEIGSVSAILSLLFFTFWFGPLPEEIGWRGFALDRLQNRFSPLNASLILGSVWALWHVPLFWIPGTFQSSLGFGTFRCWIFLSSMLPLSALITWVYNNTMQSTLSAVLIHFSGNLSGALFLKTDQVAALEVAVLVLAVAVIVIGGGLHHKAISRTDNFLESLSSKTLLWVRFNLSKHL